MSHNSTFICFNLIVKRKKEVVNNLNVFTLGGFMEVSIRNF